MPGDYAIPKHITFVLNSSLFVKKHYFLFIIFLDLYIIVFSVKPAHDKEQDLSIILYQIYKSILLWNIKV